MFSHLLPTDTVSSVRIQSYMVWEEFVPTAWREAVVIPVTKPSRDRTLTTSYRPMSWLVVFVKLWNVFRTTDLSGSRKVGIALQIFLVCQHCCILLQLGVVLSYRLAVWYPKDSLPVESYRDSYSIFFQTFSMIMTSISSQKYLHVGLPRWLMFSATLFPVAFCGMVNIIFHLFHY